jgi:hypothetical protein
MVEQASRSVQRISALSLKILASFHLNNLFRQALKAAYVHQIRDQETGKCLY